MKTYPVIAKAALAALLAASASGAGALDLLGSYERALKFDPGMRAADAALDAGREKAVQGNALFKPQVSLSAGVGRVDDRSSNNFPPAVASLLASEGSGTAHQAALQLTQPIYNAKDRADRTRLQQQSELAALGHRNTAQELMQRVAEAYFGVLLAQENLRVTQAEKVATGRQRERASARFDVGRGRITDVQEAQARYDAVLTKEVSAQSTLALRQAQYEELTGVPAEGLAPLAPGFLPLPPQPDSLPAWQSRGMDQNLRVQLKQHELAIAAADTGRYKLASRPTLELVGSYAYKGQDGGLSPLVAPDHSRIASLGLQFNLPLYAGGALDSREREAVAKHRQAEQELGAAQRDARLQVQDAFLAVKTGSQRIVALQQSALSAQMALEATLLGRDVGTRTEPDVLDAQQRLYASQLELAQARNDYLLGRIRLAYAAGELQEADLRTLNGFLVP